jgi:hypothetical protein
MEPLLDGAVGKDDWNCNCEGVWPPKAGDAWIEGEVTAERTEEARE